MTCIVAVVDNDKVWMGGDSAGVSGMDLMVRKDPKVFRVGEFLMGFTTSFRMGQILMHGFNPPTITGDLFKYMVNEFVPALRHAFKEGGFLELNANREKGGTFLVGIRGRLFMIESDFQVGETYDGYAAVGCGDQIAHGALFASKELPAKKRVKLALKAAERYSSGVRGPFLVDSI